MQQALEALEVSTDWDVGAKGKQLQSMKAITALREALAEQAEQKPVCIDWDTKTDEPIMGYAALVAANEREACAKVCEELEFHVDDKCYAAAIRAREKNDN